MRAALNAIAFAMLLAAGPAATETTWWSPNEVREFPQSLSYPNAHGVSTTLNTGGPTSTANHPFFTSHTENGRACVSCHQPSDGMSLSVETIRNRWEETQGQDPIFAANDGANCPSSPQGDAASHSIREIVDYYDRRYRIGFSEQEKQDLTNLMSVL